jgi:soluble lytic murein transglycosylase-like protein
MKVGDLMNDVILSLICYYSSIYGMDPRVAYGVAKVESNLNPSAMGTHGEIGVFQIKPTTAHLSVKELLNPETNIKAGVKYLVEMKNNCVHKQDINFLVCFNYGPENAKRVKYPSEWPYVKKVRYQMNKFKDGDKVIVEGLFNFKLDGPGIFLGISDETHYKGYFRIQNEYGHIMLIHPERVKKDEE